MEKIINENISKKELDFNEIIQRGEDFMKIQIFRNARECFQLALNMNFNNVFAQKKLDDVNIKIKDESKTIIIILTVLGLIVASVITLLSW